MTVPLYNLTDTWNNGATVFTAIQMNVTNTASAAGSLLLDLQVGGVSKFNVVADGEVNFNLPGLSGNPSMFFNTTVKMAAVTNNLIWGDTSHSNFTSGFQTLQFFWDSNGAQLYLDVLRFGGTTGEPNIFRDATGVLGQRNGANAQTLRVYNTFTNSTSYECGVIDWTTTANVLTIGAQVGVSGTLRGVAIPGASVGLYVTQSPNTPALFFGATALQASLFTHGMWLGDYSFSNFTSGAKLFAFTVDPTLGSTFNCDYFALDSLNGDVVLRRDAAQILAQRNGANAQTLRVYNTFTSSTNFERGGFDWASTANVFRIRSENGGGGGTNRIIAIDGFAKAGAAVAADIPSGTWALVRDTSGATTKLIYNNAGTLMTVALT